MTTPRRFIECTWREIKQMSETGSVIVLPVGQIVGHGPHLPVSTDVRQAEAACEAVARALDGRGVNAVVGPSIPYGNSPAQEAFPGFVTVNHDTLTNLITDVCVSLARQGFVKQIVIVFSPGCWPSIQTAAGKFARTDEPKLFIFDGLELARSLAQDLLEGHLPLEGKVDAHAGELETSLMLAIEPSSVNMERAVTHYSDLMAELRKPPFGSMSIRQQMLSINLWDWSQFGADGVTGDATLANARKGRILLDRLGTAVAEHYIKYGIQS